MSEFSRGLSNPATYKRFKDWMERNCVEPRELSRLDLDAEFGKDLTFNEAIEVALHKFPSLWRPDYMAQYENKPKQIIFVKELVKKITEGKVQVTYRKSPKVGTYYVIENRFKKSNPSKLFIEFYKTDVVDANLLSDEEAQLAGVSTGNEIRAMFGKWYGFPIPTLYRNWFRLKETAF